MRKLFVVDDKFKNMSMLERVAFAALCFWIFKTIFPWLFAPLLIMIKLNGGKRNG